jgi:hypothetical protein
VNKATAFIQSASRSLLTWHREFDIQQAGYLTGIKRSISSKVIFSKQCSKDGVKVIRKLVHSSSCVIVKGNGTIVVIHFNFYVNKKFGSLDVFVDLVFVVFVRVLFLFL